MTERAILRRAGAAALLFAGAIAGGGCGGQKGTLTVQIVVPTNIDPFAGAATVHIQVGDPAVAQQTTSISGGHFDASFDFKPPTKNVGVVAAVLVEGRTADGTVVARGRSPLLTIMPVDETVAVWVGPVGKMAVSAQSLGRGRDGVAVAALPRLGAVFAGGTVAKKPVTDVDVLYLLPTVGMVTGSGLSSARPGAIAIGFDRSSAQAGAALLAGGDSPELSLFDPLASSSAVTAGTWSTVATEASLARHAPAVAALADGSALLTGGLDQNGVPLATASLITSGSQIQVQAVAAPMATARSGHTATPMALGGGTGVLLFGGGAVGMPVTEGYTETTGSFASIDLGVPSRVGHTATALAGGRVAILGGRTPGAMGIAGPPLGSGVVVTPGTALKAQTVENMLMWPRAGHTATLAGDALLVCGGTGSDGNPIPNCEVLDGRSLALRTTIPLAAARSGHSAIVLGTGVVLLAGGTGSDGQPIAELEIYTP